MNHLEPTTLDDYAARPNEVATDVADRIEDHVLECDRCRARIASRTSAPDLDRSWASIERQLQNEWSSRTSSKHDGGLSVVASNVDPAVRAIRRPLAQMLLVATVLLGVVGGLAWVDRVRPEPSSSSAVPASWEVPRPDDDSMFTSAGDLLGISALLEWRGEALVAGRGPNTRWAAARGVDVGGRRALGEARHRVPAGLRSLGWHRCSW